MFKQYSMGKEDAINLSKSNWWKSKSNREIAQFQLFTKELCCPFRIFHEAIEESLGRPVFVHEFGLNLDGIIQEFMGKSDAPTLKEIIELIPEGKRVLITFIEHPDTPHVE